MQNPLFYFIQNVTICRENVVDKNGVLVYNEQYKWGRKGFDGDYEAR